MGVEVEGLRETMERVESNTRSVIVGTVYEFANRVKMRTPLKTGFARNSWIVTVDRDDYGDIGNNVIEARIGAVSQMQLGQTLYINNGANYIKALENGHSRQAPQGMVAITLPEVDEIIADEIADVKRAGW